MTDKSLDAHKAAVQAHNAYLDAADQRTTVWLHWRTGRATEAEYSVAKANVDKAMKLSREASDRFEILNPLGV